jgi:hypothetical protein
MRAKEKLPLDDFARNEALPPPSPKAAELASRVSELLERLEHATADVAGISKEFRVSESKLRELRELRDEHEALHRRNLNPGILARGVSLIAESEGVLSACKSRLINADAKRAAIAAEVTHITSELEAAVTAETRPIFDMAYTAFVEVVEGLTCVWVSLNAAAEAADLGITIKPSIQNPVGHEVLVNPRVLEPRIADAVGEHWRTIRSVVNRARRVA